MRREPVVRQPPHRDGVQGAASHGWQNRRPAPNSKRWFRSIGWYRSLTAVPPTSALASVRERLRECQERGGPGLAGYAAGRYRESQLRAPLDFSARRAAVQRDRRWQLWSEWELGEAFSVRGGEVREALKVPLGLKGTFSSLTLG
jgi:hypothetical protein